jgi:peptide deformylase
MAVLEILKYPHPLLKRRSQEIEKIDESIRNLIQDMIETMYDANGVGLAACQVGVNKRIIVLDVSPMDPEQDLFALINPEIVAEEEEIDHEEGCLSVPDCQETIKRKQKVRIRGMSPEGKEIELEAQGILAIALQHEVDHLNGVLILDRMSGLKREIYRNKLRKKKQKEKES